LERNRARLDLDYTGGPMPPPDAVASGKVEALSDEDRRTLVRWIDLGCPIDLDYDPQQPDRRGYGWMCDDNRPILTLVEPQSRVVKPISRILIGMHDYYSGLDESTFTVTADFPLAGHAAGENLASHFKPIGKGVWELPFSTPTKLPPGKIIVSVKDRQGNLSRIERHLKPEQP
jgi:hypothetical protein